MAEGEAVPARPAQRAAGARVDSTEAQDALHASITQCHAASAFFPSPVRRGGDPHDRRRRRVGDHHLRRRPREHDRAARQEIRFPHSLGLLYSAFTYYTGFKVNSRRIQADGPRALRRAAATSTRSSSNLIDLKRRRLVPARHALLQLLPGPDDDERAVRPRCSAARRASRSQPLTQREMDLAAIDPGGHRGGDAPHRRATCTRETGLKNLVPRRRRGAQLRRQRPAPARRAVRRHLDPARRRRRGRRAGRGALGLARPAREPSARRQTPTTQMRGRCWGRASSDAECGSSADGAAPSRALDSRRRIARRDGAIARRERSSAGSRAGWSSARARSGPLDPRRPALAEDAAVMNLKIKFRESFRPFAPAVLREEVSRLLRA